MRKAVVFKSLPPFIIRILSLCSPILRLFGKCYSFCQPTPIDYAIMVRTTDLESGNLSDGVKYIDRNAYELLAKSKIYGAN